MTTHSGTLAWRSPWTEESGRLLTSRLGREAETLWKGKEAEEMRQEARIHCVLLTGLPNPLLLVPFFSIQIASSWNKSFRGSFMSGKFSHFCLKIY